MRRDAMRCVMRCDEKVRWDEASLACALGGVGMYLSFLFPSSCSFSSLSLGLVCAYKGLHGLPHRRNVRSGDE